MTIKRTRKPLVNVYFDFETYVQDRNNPEETEVKGYLIGWKDSLTNVFCYDVEPFDKFFTYLKNLGEKYRLKLWAYNVQYDLLILFPIYLLRMDPDAEYLFKISETAPHIFVAANYRSKKLGLNLEFGDLMNWDRTASLGTWMKSIWGHEKNHIIDYDKNEVTFTGEGFKYFSSEGEEKYISLKEELEYLKDDVDIMPLIHNNIKDTKERCLKLVETNISKFKRKYLKDSSTTCSSFSKKIIDVLLFQSYDAFFRPTALDAEQCNRYLRSSMGGFCAFNKELIEGKGVQIQCMDIISMYPSIMAEAIPYGELMTRKPEESHIIWYLITYEHLEWLEPYSCISKTPINRAGEEVFILKSFYDVIKKATNNDIKIINRFYQKTKPVLSEFITTVYKRKVNATDPQERAVAKLMLNGCYGMLLKKEYLFDYKYDGTAFRSFEIDPRKLKLRLGMTGVFIAQKGRERIIKDIISEIDAGNTWISTDTDSIKVIVKKGGKTTLDVCPTGTTLGKWKEEERFTQFRFNGHDKKYFLHNPETGQTGLAIAGVRKEFAKFLLDYPDILWDIFDKDKNYLFINAKKRKKTTKKFSQPLLGYLSHLRFNGEEIEVTHSIEFKAEGKKITEFFIKEMPLCQTS